jgi:hypothetical protein
MIKAISLSIGGLFIFLVILSTQSYADPKNLSFPAQVLTDKDFQLRLDAQYDLYGDIEMIDSSGKKHIVGDLDLTLSAGSGYEGRIAGVNIEWTYRGDSHQELIEYRIQRGIPFVFTLVDDECMALTIKISEYGDGERQLTAHIYHEQKGKCRMLGDSRRERLRLEQRHRLMEKLGHR